MSNVNISLEKEIREQIIEEIKNYYWTEEAEDISNFKAENILGFFLESIGPHIYNQGIRDAYAFMMEKTEDLLGLEKRSR